MAKVAASQVVCKEDSNAFSLVIMAASLNIKSQVSEGAIQGAHWAGI